MTLLDDVKARLNIVDVVSNYVPLTQSGSVFKARCPFHTERTPSFVVNPERGSWHCFGACSEGGDAIGFVMKAENQSFSEALRTLAVRVGVPLPSPRQQAQMDPLLRANEEAMRFFQRRLQSEDGAEALAYLQDRGVAAETAADFGLGLSPDGRDELKAHLEGQGFMEEQLQRAGLVSRPQQGVSRDLFHGRLMFPIRDAEGRAVGFGGRSLDGSQPKYLNTPQTTIFDKSSLLWGLDAARDSIKLRGEGVVVEGYMDALMAHQHGYTNVVASMGTALTSRQVTALRGLADSFVLALDPDAAGQEATMRSLKTSWRDVRDVKIALLPEGKDPDELIREAPQRWPEVLEAAEPRIDFSFRIMAPRFNLDTADGRRALTEELGGELGDWILSAERGRPGPLPGKAGAAHRGEPAHAEAGAAAAAAAARAARRPALRAGAHGGEDRARGKRRGGPDGGFRTRRSPRGVLAGAADAGPGPAGRGGRPSGGVLPAEREP